MFHPLLVLTLIQCHSHLIFEPLFPNLATPNLTCRKLNSFTDFSKISSFDDLGFIICGSMGHIAVDVMINKPHLKVFGGLSVFFYDIGVAVYAFEGIGMVLPLETKVKDKQRFGRVLGLGMSSISVLFDLFGGLSVLVQLGSGMNLVNEVMERRFYGSRYCLWPRWVMELVISLVALLRVSYKNGKALSFKYGSKQFKKKGGMAARTATSNVFRSAGYKFIDG
ncbi:Amino acid transporter AVT3B [Glycine soja]